MKQIEVVVQEPTDFIFWNRVLHKHLTGARFSVRKMKSKTILASAIGLEFSAH